MRRFRVLALAAIVAAGVPAHSDVNLPPAIQVLGNVTASARPVAHALVLALNLNDFAAVQTFTGGDGSFNLHELKTGIYRVIAVKPGFAPAVATILPTRKDHRVNLRLETPQKGKSVSDTMWEIRGSLPPDILRELDLYLESEQILHSGARMPRIRGEMLSMAGLEATPSNPAFAQTALGVESRIGERWQIGVRGDIRRFDDPSDDQRFGPPIAQSSIMSMEVRSSDRDLYRVASTMSSWRYRDDDAQPYADREADIRAHNFEWEHGDARVQVRYLNQENLHFANLVGSELIEIGGGATLIDTSRNDVGVSLRVTQESLHNASTDPFRSADLAANGSFALAPSFAVLYGLTSRIGLDGAEWAPRTGVELKLRGNTSFIVTGSYKLNDYVHQGSVLPMIVVFSDQTRTLPRYTYSFGVTSGADENNRFSAVATITEMDAPIRMVFENAFDGFWDGMLVNAGDVRRDVRLAYRRLVGDWIAVDVSTSAGSATARDTQARKVYLTGDLQSTFTPTRTSIAVSYREIEQPEANGRDYKSERVNVRMAQSLYLPVDVKLLVGMEVARATNSPFLVDAMLTQGTARKYIGGLALNF